jgi:hypothetical protein
MAITATAKYKNGITLPVGYTNPTLPSITPIQTGAYTVDVTAASVQDASNVTCAGNIVTAIETDFTANQVGILNLDTAATIQVNLTIATIERISDGDDTGQFTTGVLVYRMNITYDRT